MNTTMTVSDSLNFLLDEQTEYLKKEISEVIEKSPNAEDFREATFIFAESSRDSKSLQSIYGVELALDILRKNPKAKVILMSTFEIKTLRHLNDKIDLVMKYDNSRFFCHLRDKEEFAKELQILFQEPKPERHISEFDVSKVAQNSLSHILHDLNYVENWQQPAKIGEQKLDRFKECMQKAKNYFPGLCDCSDEEVVDFLITAKKSMTERKKVMSGEKISGVYCDVEGTLLCDGKLNSEVVQLLEKYAKQGKNITVWTDGNPKEIQEQLEALGAYYKVESKRDFAGALAEIVIDDMEEFAFSALTKISAKKFIRV